jgi:hypothetical protein
MKHAVFWRWILTMKAGKEMLQLFDPFVWHLIFPLLWRDQDQAMARMSGSSLILRFLPLWQENSARH